MRPSGAERLPSKVREMPELPEVETIRRDLEPRFVGRRLDGLDVLDPRVLQGADFPVDRLAGQPIQAVGRRGKYLVYRLRDGTIIQHLRMTGTMLSAGSPHLPPEAEKCPTLKLRARFRASGGRSYYFFDQRRFGTLDLVEDPEAYFARRRLAPELFGAGTRRQARRTFFDRLGATRRSLKAALLDQTVVCGVGNIYADEALHRAGLHPLRISRTCSCRELDDLFAAVVSVLEEAIAKRGTSMSDYLDVNGDPGVFRRYLAVYGRAGLPCRRCETPIEKGRAGGRSSHYCPSCQPARGPRTGAVVR